MKVTDYIIEYLIENNVTDIFGYPGGVICHLIDSATKYEDKISTHTNYHEQASAFAACSYAQETNNLGVAFATSGPGAINFATGIANAYYDSIPTLFLTGQVDTYGLKGNLNIRQKGFQEADIVEIYKPITKYAVRVDDPNDIVYELQKAVFIAKSCNPGPVIIDLPADVQRANVDIESCKKYTMSFTNVIKYNSIATKILSEVKKSKRPCLIVGNGVKQSGCKELLSNFIERLGIPAVFSMPAVDTIPYDNEYNFGFIGANGHRYANYVLLKSDLIITLGSRLDLKQVGNDREHFLPHIKKIRIDIDKNNFENSICNEECIVADLKYLLPELINQINFRVDKEWVNVCETIKVKLIDYDNEDYNDLLRDFGASLPDNCTLLADVGQSEVWVAQQIHFKSAQSFHISSGLGAMGYSLPAAIGAFYGKKRLVCSFNGDGGIQMNIQELQFLNREKIPIWVVIINNKSLGMIRGFQEANFDGNYSQTIEGRGYSSPNFENLSKAYGLQYISIETSDDIKQMSSLEYKPAIIEIKVSDKTVLKPNFGKNGLSHDQSPYINRGLFNEIMSL